MELHLPVEPEGTLVAAASRRGVLVAVLGHEALDRVVALEVGDGLEVAATPPTAACRYSSFSTFVRGIVEDLLGVDMRAD